MYNVGRVRPERLCVMLAGFRDVPTGARRSSPTGSATNGMSSKGADVLGPKWVKENEDGITSQSHFFEGESEGYETVLLMFSLSRLV